MSYKKLDLTAVNLTTHPTILEVGDIIAPVHTRIQSCKKPIIQATLFFLVKIKLAFLKFSTDEKKRVKYDAHSSLHMHKRDHPLTGFYAYLTNKHFGDQNYSSTAHWDIFNLLFIGQKC